MGICPIHKTNNVFDEQSGKYVCIKCGNIELKKYHEDRLTKKVKSKNE